MSPQVHPDNGDDMRPDYDFSQGVRGKHYQGYRAGTNVVFLEPDLLEAFPDSASVNRALRLLVRLAQTKAVQKSRPNKAPQPPSRARRKAKANVVHARLAAERQPLDGNNIDEVFYQRVLGAPAERFRLASQ